MIMLEPKKSVKRSFFAAGTDCSASLPRINFDFGFVPKTITILQSIFFHNVIINHSDNRHHQIQHVSEAG
jgi:hypothetical protein